MYYCISYHIHEHVVISVHTMLLRSMISGLSAHRSIVDYFSLIAAAVLTLSVRHVWYRYVMTVLTWQSKVPGSCAHNQALISQRWKSCAPCSHEKYIISDNKTEQNTRIISGRVKNSVLPVLSQGYLPITCTSDPRPPTYLRWNYDVQTEKCAWRIPACGHFGR